MPNSDDTKIKIKSLTLDNIRLPEDNISEDEDEE